MRLYICILIFLAFCKGNSTTVEELEEKLVLIINDKIEEGFQKQSKEDKLLKDVARLKLDVEQCKTNMQQLKREQRRGRILGYPKKVISPYHMPAEVHVKPEPVIPEQENNTVDYMQQLLTLFVLPSCHHWKKAGFTVSGNYVIDPDGVAQGEAPFKVYCDMITGFTFVVHDLQDSYGVPPGSFTTVTPHYNVSMSQIHALKEASHSCQQFIKIGCLNNPLMNASWWVGSDDETHSYWSGDGSKDNVCSCGLSRSCIDSRYTCNCDANIPDVMVSDEGYISNKASLPIKSLHFGRGDANTEMIYMLGPLRCSGDKDNKSPESCEDLWRNGVTETGYHIVGNKDDLKVTYCNINTKEQKTVTSLLSSGDIQRNTEIYAFSAGRTSSYNKVDTIVPFNDVQFNEGNGYNAETGKFTVKKSGIYIFSLFANQDSNNNARLNLRRNAKTIAWTHSGHSDPQSTMSLTTMVKLDVGDIIDVILDHGHINGYSGGSTVFNGALLY